jgi:UDP-N-acetylmuramoyl-tripeptide--D-alanyl-D-alanine ligase
MLELGDYAPQLHHEVGEAAEEIADILVTVGENAKYINEGFGHPESPERSYHFDNNEQAADLLRNILREGDTVLVKASRGMKFEQIYKALTE